MTAKPKKAQIVAAAKALGVDTRGTAAEVASRVVQFGYQAVEDKGRRQSPQTRVKHEAVILPPRKRSKLNSTVQDQVRNLSIVAWMVRHHLDYVSKFHFSFRSGNEALDAVVNAIFKWHGRPRNMDVAGRLGRDEFIRLFELEKVCSGDAAMRKLDGIKLQAIESDLIAKPKVVNPDDKDKVPDGLNDEGLVVSDVGGREQFCVCNRGSNGKDLVFDQMVPADEMIFDAYWTRYSSQNRGVSPLSTAINTVQDIHEGLEFNVVKAKMHALFGLAILRKAGNGEMGGVGGATTETTGAQPNATGTTTDLDPRAINLLDLDPDEDVKVIESGTPSSEFVEGSYLFIQIAMLALDIPITFFDSRRSSFSARIADLNVYEVSADTKRTKNRYVLQEYSDWVLDELLKQSDDRGLKVAMKAAGVEIEAVKGMVEWIPAGSPWLDKLKQVMGDKEAIGLGLDNRLDAARRRGADVFRNIDKEAEVLNYAKAKGVPLAVAGSIDETVLALITDGGAANE